MFVTESYEESTLLFDAGETNTCVWDCIKFLLKDVNQYSLEEKVEFLMAQYGQMINPIDLLPLLREFDLSNPIAFKNQVLSHKWNKKYVAIEIVDSV